MTGAKRMTESPRMTAARASTSSDPRRRTFQPAWRTAAARARANASGGTQPLGRVSQAATNARQLRRLLDVNQIAATGGS